MKRFTKLMSGLAVAKMANAVKRVFLPVLLLLLLTGMESWSQLPVVRVRFTNPVYTCTTKSYCVDVEFQSNTTGLELFGMNVRFLYDDKVLEFGSFGDFAGEYGKYNPDPPVIMTGFAGSGASFGFTGPLEYVNGAIQLQNLGPHVPVLLTTTGWTRIFSICFQVDDPDAFLTGELCPSLVWDMELVASDGGYFPGDDGVVILIVDNDPLTPEQSAPVTAEVVQYNWAYDGTSAAPYGAPVATVCIPAETVPPVITTQAVSRDLGCNPLAITAPEFAATDNCDATVTVTVTTGGATGNGCMWSQTWTANSQDALGNAALPVSITYSWTVDTTPPVLTGCPATAVNLGVNPAVPDCSSALALITATDGCSGAITPTCSAGAVISEGCGRSQVFTLTAEDVCGNSASCAVTFVWSEETGFPDFFGCPEGPILLGCNPAVLPDCTDALALVDVIDGCNGTLTPTCTAGAIVENGCLRSQSFVLSATNHGGNTSTCTVVYTWKFLNDIEMPGNQGSTVTCISLATQPAAPVVTDACGNTITPTGPVTGGSYNGCEGTRTYTYHYADCGGNNHDWVYTYQISLGDFAAHMPANGGQTVVSVTEAIAPAAPPVTDNCGNTITPTGPVRSENLNGCLGTIWWTYTYTDCANVSHNWVYTYNIVRTTPPAEAGGPVATGTTVDCITKVTAPTVLPLVKDVAGVTLQATAESPVVVSVGNSCSATITYTYKYIDCAGLTFNWVFTVRAVDNIPPVFVVPADVTIQAGLDCTYDAGPEKTGYPSQVSDNCATGLVPAFTDVKGNGLNPGEILITRTWKLNDGCDNIRTAVQKITVIGGDVPPILVLKDYCVYLNKYGKWTLNASELASIVAGSTAYCGTSTDLTFDITPRAFECKDIIAPVTAVVTARDLRGNTVTGTIQVLVLDTISPVAKCQDAVLYLDKFGQAFLTQDMINDGNDRESTPDWAKHFNDLEGGSYDNCGISDLYLDKQLFTKSTIGKTHVTLTAVDPSGNTGECGSWVTVYDTITPPVTIALVNTAPTLSEIRDMAIVREPLSFEVQLTGITAGKETDQKVTSVSAVTDNKTLLTGLQVIYIPGETTGLLKISLTSGQSGEAMVTVKVTDNGGTANGGMDMIEKQFRVTVSAEKGTVLVTITDPTGTAVTTDVLKVNDEFGMKLWPNPTSGKVNIDLTWSNIREIDLRVSSVLGTEVLHRKYKAGDVISFDLSRNSSGLYLVEMNVEGVSIIHKLILDRK